jgi:phage shock protein A
MGFFKRAGDIVSANINDLLDKMENPDKMMKQLVREMEAAVAKVKEDLVTAIANTKRIEKEIASQKAKIAEWQARAVDAVKRNRDDLARKALELKRDCQAILTALEPELNAAKEAAAAVRTQYRALQAKTKEAKRKQATFSARAKAAQTRKRAAGMRTGGGKVKTEAFDEFEKMEEKVAQVEAEAEAAVEVNVETRARSADARAVEDEFADMEATDEIDAELASLKKKSRKKAK